MSAISGVKALPYAGPNGTSKRSKYDTPAGIDHMRSNKIARSAGNARIETPGIVPLGLANRKADQRGPSTRVYLSLESPDFNFRHHFSSQNRMSELRICRNRGPVPKPIQNEVTTPRLSKLETRASPPMIEGYSILKYQLKVPTELISIVIGLLTGEGDDDSALAISVAATNLRRLVNVSRCIEAVCISCPKAWTNISINARASNVGLSLPSISDVLENIHRSGTLPLRVHFNLRVSTITTSDRPEDRMWRLITGQRHRLGVIHLEGTRGCESYRNFLCLRGMASSAGIGRDTPILKVLSLLFCNDLPPTLCGLNHEGQLWMGGHGYMLEKVASHVPMRTSISITPAAPAMFDSLTFLDIANQPAATWTAVLSSSPNLQSMIWRNNKHIASGSTAICMPNLKQLQLYSVHIPRIYTPNLTHLIAKDSLYALDNVTFSCLTGGSAVVDRLAELDLGTNPSMTNGDLDAIIHKCSQLTRLRLNTNVMARTECFRTLGKRIIGDYIAKQSSGFRQLVITAMPTGAAAQKHFQFLLRLGQVNNGAIEFYEKVFCVECQGCSGGFNYRDLEFLEKFKEDNRFDSSLIAVSMYVDPLHHAEQPRDSFSIILVFTNEYSAEKCVSSATVAFRGDIHVPMKC
ncbi:hypothetical protein DFH06DRAFT_1145856 [Mycena polygramma]|nr:hypothetical protein DFH06DRAFT_1145856 [Mycena polygramma]